MSRRKTTPWLNDSIAPNGRSVRDNFCAWFRDSKVVTRSGRPLIVYHGTPATFTAFEMHNGVRLRGAYFTSDKFGAEDWGSRGGDEANVIAVYLSLQNPATDQTSGPIWTSLYDSLGRQPTQVEFTQALMAAGFDGYVGSNYTEKDATEFIAFRPEQIKSATANSGNYDPTSACILDAALEPAPSKPTQGMAP